MKVILYKCWGVIKLTPHFAFNYQSKEIGATFKGTYSISIILNLESGELMVPIIGLNAVTKPGNIKSITSLDKKQNLNNQAKLISLCA